MLLQALSSVTWEDEFLIAAFEDLLTALSAVALPQ